VYLTFFHKSLSVIVAICVASNILKCVSLVQWMILLNNWKFWRG